MLKIMIVDDSLIIRKKIAKIVEDLGHSVIFNAQNAQEAITAYTQERADFVTMDITMPDMDGITALRAIMQIDLSAKVVMVTSHGQEEMVIKSIQAGAVGYILKPITHEKLEQSIGEIFTEYRRESDEFLEE
ncbi:MAG: response regulator [Campylobacterales bacterium]|nr:response regulator [Campylobacterales bacterium]